MNKKIDLLELSEIEKEIFEERSAICENDGYLTKEVAEEIAVESVLYYRETLGIVSKVNETNDKMIKKDDLLISARDIQLKKIKPVEWIIPDLLPEGLAILASRPKLGKSWLCLNFSFSICFGTYVLGIIKVEPKNVLYVYYEDSERRLQDRVNMLLKSSLFPSAEAPDNLHFLYGERILKIDEGGLDVLGEYVEKHKLKLIIIDTLGRATKHSSSPKQNYFREYQLIAEFQQFAMERKICLLFVHHTRKPLNFDNYIIDEIQGTTGVTAGADTLFVLTKNKSNYTLHVTGKDVIADELSLKFDRTNCSFTAENIDSTIDTTPERMGIITLLSREGRAMKTSEISEKLNKKQSNISTLLNKLTNDGLIKNPKYGVYSL